MNGWIPITERKPPEGKLVLVTGNSGISTHPRYMMTASYDGSCASSPWLDVCHDHLTDTFGSNSVTHWRNRLPWPEEGE